MDSERHAELQGNRAGPEAGLHRAEFDGQPQAVRAPTRYVRDDHHPRDRDRSGTPPDDVRVATGRRARRDLDGAHQQSPLRRAGAVLRDVRHGAQADRGTAGPRGVHVLVAGRQEIQHAVPVQRHGRVVGARNVIHRQQAHEGEDARRRLPHADRAELRDLH